MLEAPHTPYDEVRYPSALYTQTHPDRLATIAIVFGMQPAPVENCRVLELGCNDGHNLIAMAYGLPKSQFVGIDLAAQPIATGQETVKALGLTNVSLRQLNVLDAASDLGLFDFIIAHGLYSWVPAEVRDKVLALCGAYLTAHGVAYISYNTYPGNHLRDLARGMMRYHSAHFLDPQQQIGQARALLKFVAESQPQPEVYHQVLQKELERVRAYSDPIFFHDDLSPINHPVYFHEFIDHARRHGLQYLAEAEMTALQDETYPPHVTAVLNALDPDDIVAREQYRDFLKGRAFRQTLLCRQEVHLNRDLKPERLRTLYVAADLRPSSPDLEIASHDAVVFRTPTGATLATDRPLLTTAFSQLGAQWPRAFSFNELLTQVRHSLAKTQPERSLPTEEDAHELGSAIWQAARAGYVELQTYLPHFVTTVSDCPTVSMLSRWQIRHGTAVSTLRHQTLSIDDELGKQLVLLLDGFHDRAALLKELGLLIHSGAVMIQRNGELIMDRQEAMRFLTDTLEASLTSLARAAVLIA